MLLPTVSQCLGYHFTFPVISLITLEITYRTHRIYSDGEDRLLFLDFIVLLTMQIN